MTDAKRVLIVDDEPAIVISLDFLMRSAGFETAVARDGEEAIAQAAVFAPHLVLLDVMLPKLSGMEVVAKLRACEAHKALQIVLLTAKGGVGMQLAAAQARVDLYVVKPFATQELLQQVRDLLRLEK